MNTPSNDNGRAGRMVRIVGRVGEDGRVTITDPTWRAAPKPAPALRLVAGDAPRLD